MPQILDLITPTSYKVIHHFTARPASEFHEREIIRVTGVSKGSANRILRRMAELQLLIRTEKGRMVFYRLSAADPFIRQLKIAENVWGLRALVGDVKEAARKVILFGSCAEGTDGPESDIDLLVVTDDIKAVGEKIGAFNRKAARQIAPIIVSLNEFAMMKMDDRPLFERVDRGVVLWETT